MSASAVDHTHPFPNGSPAHAQWAWEQTLHVAAVYVNPCRYRRRLELFNNFRRHMNTLPGVKLYVGELAYGDRPFEVTRRDCPTDFQWRTTHELWHKENILNLVIERFDRDWKYGAYCDGDFQWTRHDIALETIHQLQHYAWVQMFAHHTNLTYGHTPNGVGEGFVRAILEQEALGKPRDKYQWPGSPGGAWAFTRAGLDVVGGLLDTCILGSGDYFMARALMQVEHTHEELYGCGEPYARSILAWHHRAARLNKNIGYVDAHVCHHHHGPVVNRGYNWRWKILRTYTFDPFVDVFRDVQGVYQLTPDKPAFRDAIRRYFKSRDEDDVRDS